MSFFFGNAPTADGTFSNQYHYRPSGGTWNPLQTASLLDASRAVGAGEMNRSVVPHTWTGGVGTWEFRLFADSGGSVKESKETDNPSAPTTVEIVDFTPTLTPNPATALPARGAQAGFVGDTITFTADSVLYGTLQDKTKVSYANFKCDTSGAPAPKPINATSFSCTYTTAGTKTASVSALYYKIPKTATAPVTITPKPLPDLVALSPLSVSPTPNSACLPTDTVGTFCYRPGTTIVISGKIKNQGQTKINRAFNNGLRDAKTNTDISGAAVQMNALDQNTEQPYRYTFSTLSYGTKPVKLCADSGGDIDESDETNNCSNPITIKVPKRKPKITFYIDTTGTCPNAKAQITIAPNTQTRLCWKVDDILVP